MLATAFIAHYNAAKFYVELERPTMERYGRVVAGGFGAAVLFFCAVATAGFRTFGSGCTGFILNSYAKTDQLATAARAAVGLAIVCTYPLLFSGVRDGVFELLGSSPERAEELRSPLTVGLVALTVLAGIFVTDLGFVCAFGGAIFGSTVIYIIPASIALGAAKSGSLKLGRVEKALCKVIRATGVALGAIGGTIVVLKNLGRL